MSTAGVRRLTAGEIAALTGGRLVGSPDAVVDGVAPLERAGPSHLSFLAASRYLPYFQRTRASVVLLRQEHAETAAPVPARIVVHDPHAALQSVLPALYPQPVWQPGIHPTATLGRGARWEGPVAIGPYVAVGEGARLGRNVRLGAGCVVGAGVIVGDDSELHPRVVCYPGVVLGARVLVHAGVVLGADGFGYVRAQGRPEHHKIAHVGRVLVGDDVEIGANASIDRGSIDDTVIGPGTKIDSLVQIGHNVRIGARCLIMAQVGIAGSTQIGDDAIVAGQAGIVDHCVIGPGARVGAQSGVTGDVPAGGVVLGYPARERRQWLRAQAAMYRLTKIVDELERIAKRPP